VSRSRRKRYEQHHALAAEGVLAYLRDEDADLSNIMDAAVQADALAAAWNLTALAAASVRLLAERTGVTPEAALAEVVERGYGGLFRAPQPAKKAWFPPNE
jgi:hypothetical protein